MTEARTGTPEQTLPKTDVYHRTIGGINTFRSLFEPISPVNFWNLGGHLSFVGKAFQGSVDLKLDGQNGRTGLNIRVLSSESRNISFDLDEPLIEGQEDENQSHFSHTLLRGGSYDDDFSTDSQRAWDEIIRLRQELETEALVRRIVLSTSPN